MLQLAKLWCWQLQQEGCCRMGWTPSSWSHPLPMTPVWLFVSVLLVPSALPSACLSRLLVSILLARHGQPLQMLLQGSVNCMFDVYFV